MIPSLDGPVAPLVVVLMESLLLTCSMPVLSMCGPLMSVKRLFFQSTLTGR